MYVKKGFFVNIVTWNILKNTLHITFLTIPLHVHQMRGRCTDNLSDSLGVEASAYLYNLEDIILMCCKINVFEKDGNFNYKE